VTARDWETLLLPELRQALPGHSGTPLTLTPARPSLDYTNSQLHFFNLLTDGQVLQEVAVKEAREAAWDEMQIEYEGMKQLWAHLGGHPRIRAPRPLFCLTQPPALVMEAIAGERLNRVLAACRRPQQRSQVERALRCTEMAGEALSLLHQIAPTANAIPLPPPAERAEAALRRLHAVGVPAGQIDALRRQIEALLPSAPPPGPLVALHGDYTLRNLLYAVDGRLYILDTSLDAAGPPAHDVGYFLAALAFIDRWQLLAGRLAWPPAALAAMRRSFLAGYGPIPDPDAGALALFTVLRLLERWGQYAGRAPAGRLWVGRGVFGARLGRYFMGEAAKAAQRKIQPV
jgi:aminoglycoside phosphotransferase (APT) family kinase protein